ncbi:MAG: hypothetical protein PHX62_01310 [Bacilli bacterium]|nr:hypothetical protein [Bacilli bacterium]
MAVLCIDLKSFYASVECVLRGLDPFETNLVVADKERGPGSIVLAVSPKLKTYGVSSRCRIYSLPKDLKIIYAKPRMKKYIEYSTKIYRIYLKYVAKEDIHVYSIDEAFLDLTHYLKYYNKEPKQIAKEILDDIFKETKITASCGIGDNMFLSKVALDILAKHSKDNIAILDAESFKEKIWKVEPLSSIWGIGSRLEKRLHKMGIKNLGNLAKHPLSSLEKEFGVVGRELLEHAYGIEKTTVQEARNYLPQSKSFGHGQVLYEDYSYQNLEVILIETVDEIATELVTKRLTCQLIGLSIGYSKSDGGGGFGRQRKLPCKTNSRKLLVESFFQLYYDFVEDKPIRQISLRVGSLDNEDFFQTNLFIDANREIKEHNLYQALGEIRQRYGKNSVHLAVSNTDKSTFLKRNNLIGGHNAE